MGTVFPFTTSEVGHPSGVPIGFNKQTGLPILYDNFSPKLTNYNMVIFGKSGAGKSVTIKTITARSAVLMGIESLAIDAEGEYGIVAEALGGVNVVISPNSKTVINLFDIEPENIKDEITGKERTVLSVENKVEDVTNSLLTMARGSTKSQEVNELTKQIISEAVSEEYAALGITDNVESLYRREDNSNINMTQSYLGRTKKQMPTIGSWFKRVCRKAEENENPDYRFHYSYLVKVMRQFVREYNGQMAYFDGQSTFELLDGVPFINIDISQLEERFARPLAQQVMLSWIWEKYVKKNSEDKAKAAKKRVLVDEAWMLLPYPEAVDFLNTMARRARKRNVSLAVISQKFQDFYEKKEVQAVLTSSETKLFLAQDKSEIQYLKEVFKLSEGEAGFLITCGRGEGLLKVGGDSAILAIQPTKKEFEFVETNLSKQAAMEKARQEAEKALNA
jgi:type IV secretory pathway VirB4 component